VTISQSLGLTDSFCITEFPLSSEYLYGGTGKCVYLGLSSCRIYFKFSYILWEIWKFISPALYKNEKKKCISSFFLRYFSLLECCLAIILYSHVSVNFKVGDLVLNQFTLDSYIGLVKRPFWQVGYFTNYYLFLDKGISDSAFLRTYRKYAIVISCRWLP
jgi:sec-independent protein translocase protein TatC